MFLTRLADEGAMVCRLLKWVRRWCGSLKVRLRESLEFMTAERGACFFGKPPRAWEDSVLGNFSVDAAKVMQASDRSLGKGRNHVF